MTETDTPTKLMTVAEYAEWGERPENADRRTELVDGEVIDVPPAGEIHCHVIWLVVRLLNRYIDARGQGSLLLNDSGFVVSRNPGTVRGIDVLFFAESPTAPLQKLYTARKPTLCVEVVSPSDRPGQLQKRVTQYLKAGVPLVWVVYPEIEAVVVHRPDAVAEVFPTDAELVAEPELPGFACRVSALFDMPGRA